jgi:site-specific DNA recombinase
MRRRRDIFPAGFPAPTRPSTYSRRDARHDGRSERGRRWLDEMIAGTVTSVEHIAARDKCSIRQVNMTISLAFLAPELVRQPSRDDCLGASASLGCAMLGLSI